MSDRHDPVEAAFDALRADTGRLDAAEPLRAVTRHRPFPVPARMILGGALAAVIAVLGLLLLRGDEGDDVVAGPPETTDQTGDGAVESGAVAGSSWTLVEGRGRDGEIPVVDGWPITLSFDLETFGGTAACNGYGGGYSIDAGEIALTELAWTEMACDGTVMESEAAFLVAIQDVDAIGVVGDELLLSGPSTELRFTLNAPVPVAELIGQLWLLDSLIQGEGVSSVQGDPATLILNDDGTLEGGTGCRSVAGEYVVSGNQVLFTSFGADGECPSQLRDQDNIVVTVLGDGFTAEVEAGRLTLTSAGNEGLGYRAITEDELAEIEGSPVLTDAELLAGTVWVLSAGEGPLGPIEIVPGFEPTIGFSGEGTVEGNLSCNEFTAGVTFDGSRLEITDIDWDLASCGDSRVMNSEEALRTALLEVEEFAVEGDEPALVMTGGSTELLFRIAGTSPPVDSDAYDVTRLLDVRPAGNITVAGAAIDSGGGWILCDGIDPDRYLGCSGRWVTVTNFDPGIDAVGEGSWEGSLTEDNRFAIAGRDSGITATVEELALADAYANLAVEGTTVDTTGLQLADAVLLGLADQLIVERTAAELAELANWELSHDAFRARVGPFSAAELLRDGGVTDVLVGPTGAGVQVVVGPHDHCASPPSPISEQISYESQLSLQPTGIDSCLQWFAVDLFLGGDGEVVAITLDLYEP